MNLLVLLEVADRLSLKNDLEIARDIQQAMLPSGVYSAPGVETVGISRPANTVGGDFYDILPLDDGRLVVAVGDVAGKGSPAALLMALLLAMLRTLVDEKLEPADLITRLNVQVCRHAPGTRFITLFYAVYQPLTGDLTYVSAGHMPPLRAARRRRLRAAHRRRHLARHVRAFDVHDRTRRPPAGRPARGLQRRHHRGGEPGRHAVRRDRPRDGAEGQRPREPVRGRRGGGRSRSNGTRRRSGSPTT